MTPDQQRELVIQHLSRREEIVTRTKAHLDTFKEGPADPLAEVDPSIREQVEDEFYASLGKRRYTTSDGRVIFLRPQEIEKRRHAKEKKRQKDGRRFYGASGDARQRRLRMLGFNVGAVFLALIVVYFIMKN